MLSDRLSALHGVKRVRTGLPILDAACRGGIPLGKRVVVGGAPGAGKTTLLTQWSLNLARQGCKVVFLATDENADAIAIRLGQLLGGNRDKLERGDPEELAKVRSGLDTLPLDLLEDLTIEQAVTRLGTTGPRVLVVDSLQTARCDEHARLRGKRGRIEANVRALKIAARSGALVLATSELSRQGYRAKTGVGSIADYKGSGDIEYDVDLGLAMRTFDRGQSSQVEVTKSRIGGKPDFVLYLDPVRAEFSPEKKVFSGKAIEAKKRFVWRGFGPLLASLICWILDVPE